MKSLSPTPIPPRLSGILFAGHHGRVHAIDKQTGDVLWTNELKGFSYDVVSIVPDTTDTVAKYLSFAEPRGPINTPVGSPPFPMLFVGSHGKLCALDMLSGREIWRTEVGGFMYQCMSMVVPMSQDIGARPHPLSNNHILPTSPSPYYVGGPHHILFVATYGKVRAFTKPALVSSNKGTGYLSNELWQYDFPGGGYGTPSLLFDSSIHATPVLFVGGRGRVACINAMNGSEVWSLPLPGMAGTWVSLADAKGGAWGNNAYAASSSQPILQAHRLEERNRRRRN
ncbi:hypothetical protein HK102_009442 [Quaeritorhiza haematococci]|nr:hypothetical protein HK102_009442 [Quaeritorhiza haematococci]